MVCHVLKLERKTYIGEDLYALPDKILWNGGTFILKPESAQVPVLCLFDYEFDRLHFGCCVALEVCIEILGPKKNPRVFWKSQWKKEESRDFTGP